MTEVETVRSCDEAEFQAEVERLARRGFQMRSSGFCYNRNGQGVWWAILTLSVEA